MRTSTFNYIKDILADYYKKDESIYTARNEVQKQLILLYVGGGEFAVIS